MIHVLQELSPLITGVLSGLVMSIQNRRKHMALSFQAILAIGAAFAFTAGELGGTLPTAVASIIVGSGAFAAGLVVTHLVVGRFAMVRLQFRKP